MLTTITILYKIKLPKIQLFCVNKQLNLNLMRQFLFAHVSETKSRNLTAEKPVQFFWEFWKIHCFVFTQKSVRALISFQLATPQCGLVLKKKITGHIPVLHENGEIIFSTSADDNVLLRYPSLFICYFSSLKPFLLLVYLFLGNMNSKFLLRCH